MLATTIKLETQKIKNCCQLTEGKYITGELGNYKELYIKKYYLAIVSWSDVFIDLEKIIQTKLKKI